MSTKSKIKQRLQENAPIFSDNEVFMKDVIRLDVVRWILVGSGGAIVIVYLLFAHYELLINAMVGFLDFL